VINPASSSITREFIRRYQVARLGLPPHQTPGVVAGIGRARVGKKKEIVHADSRHDLVGRARWDRSEVSPEGVVGDGEALLAASGDCSKQRGAYPEGFVERLFIDGGGLRFALKVADS